MPYSMLYIWYLIFLSCYIYGFLIKNLRICGKSLKSKTGVAFSHPSPSSYESFCLHKFWWFNRNGHRPKPKNIAQKTTSKCRSVLYDSKNLHCLKTKNWGEGKKCYLYSFDLRETTSYVYCFLICKYYLYSCSNISRHSSTYKEKNFIF